MRNKRAGGIDRASGCDRKTRSLREHPSQNVVVLCVEGGFELVGGVFQFDFFHSNSPNFFNIT